MWNIRATDWKIKPGNFEHEGANFIYNLYIFFLYIYILFLQRKGVVLIYVAFNRNQRHGCILLCKVKHIRNNNKVHKWHLQCFSKRTFFFYKLHVRWFRIKTPAIPWLSSYVQFIVKALLITVRGHIIIWNPLRWISLIQISPTFC